MHAPVLYYVNSRLLPLLLLFSSFCVIVTSQTIVLSGVFFRIFSFKKFFSM